MNYPYHEFVSRLCKSGDQITSELTPDQAHSNEAAIERKDKQ